MKKISIYIFISFILFGSFLSIPIEKVEAQAPPPSPPPCQPMPGGGYMPTPRPCALPGAGGGILEDLPPADPSAFSCITGLSSFSTCMSNAVGFVLGTIFYAILTMFALIIGIAGSFLDHIIKFTIIDLRDNIASLQGINIAWKVVKDLMNIVFIFLLVYEGIKMIIGQGSRDNVKKFISMLVLASLLVNFSLFFTRVLVDASNIVTIGLYDTIVDRNAPANLLGYTVYGISSPYMKALGLSSFYSSNSIDSMRSNAGGDMNLILIPLLGIGLFLVVSFVFVAMALMLLIRFVSIVLLMMLSPIAFMGMALPLVSGYSKEWWNTLTGQLLYPPIFMLMTWISLTLMTSQGFFTGGNWGTLVDNPGAPGTMQMILSFAIIIGLAISSITVAKTYSSKGSKILGELTNKASGLAGTSVFGVSAWAGRKTLGAYGNTRASDVDLQDAAKNGTGARGAWARTKLYTARTMRDATYDGRNASVPTSMLGDVVRGTAGRLEVNAFGKNYKVGEALGLNDFNTKSIPIGGSLIENAGGGKGGTATYVTAKKESEERVQKRKAEETNELELAVARRDLTAGKDAAIGTPEYDAFEKALAKLSDKQTVALVESNKELLDSSNFANKISVKTLEAIEKSEKIIDEDKDKLKNRRFARINDINFAPGLAALAVTGRPLTAQETLDAQKVKDARSDLKGLSDSEMEMLDQGYFDKSDPRHKEFAEQIKPSQAETILSNKSGKYTSTVRDTLKNTRRQPLFNALTSGIEANIIKEARKLDAKALAGYMSADPVHGKIALNPAVIQTYHPDKLKRMAAEMTNDNDKEDLKQAIINDGRNTKAINWLEDDTKGGVDFI